ncbi:F-box/FBD/LRR-repeat protein At1g13570-like isoform X1 [Rutidosis leptorrhynchoides]|uniref:F-box/FBD/LRR-repeat protein At1g13570-like isoform X1 n=1 Tax=Rutidosis leptorrhynchoides TaxID=125765 RepID=UPI003A9926AC
MDMISKLPPGIIETILCLLPIQEAARTSILSKEWRYHWIKIPKLVFDEDTFEEVSANGVEVSGWEPTFEAPNQRKKLTKRCRCFYAIFQVLLMHEGPIHEFTLSIDTDDSCVEIDQIIFHLSRKNTVKKLTLEFLWDYRLPKSLFSLHQLTDLYLIRCDVYYEPTFNGFSSLTSLWLEAVMTSKETLMHLLSNCPLLDTLYIWETTINVTDDSSIINLFECLPVIENLSIFSEVIESFAQGGVPRKLPTALIHLKYLCIESVSFIHIHGLPILGLLIRSSPNLEKLKIGILDDSFLKEAEKCYSLTVDDYSDIWLENLNELEIINMGRRMSGINVVKLILGKSPMLKKVKIFLDYYVTKDEELEITRSILYSSHASPMIKFDVKNRCNS